MKGVDHQDMTQAAQVKGLMESTIQRFGRLDVILSNAAILQGGSVVDLSEDAWDAMFAVNVKGHTFAESTGFPP